MGKIVKKIVLTGGPCAGKTTALAKIEKDLSEKGYTVFIVSESATELIKSGVKPFGDCISTIDFQRVILDYQKNKEANFDYAASLLDSSKKCVIIYDRGIMDNKAYITDKQFKQIVEEKKLKEIDLLDSYDLVLHLTTAADGAIQFYTLENNEARSESPEEAIALDKQTRKAWLGHTNLKIIDNSSSFEDKMNIVLDEIHNTLGNPISLKYQKKYLVDLNESDLSFLNDDNSTLADIEQTYLVNSLAKDSCEIRLRKRTIDGNTSYQVTTQKKEKEGLSKVITEKTITEKDYEKVLSQTENRITLKKKRYSFLKKKQYFRLDVFENNMAILEIEPTKQNKSIVLPKQFSILKEVTNDSNFNNYHLATTINNKIKVQKRDLAT